MPAAQTAAQLTAFERRGPGTESERLAARWLRGEAESTGREATIETFWCRPNWALAHSWHVLLGVAGSLVMVSDARLGGALCLLALVFVLADWLTGRSPGRRLTREHASQNVVSRPGRNGAEDAQDTVRLIVTANYDAGRTGLAHRPWLRRTTALPRRFAAVPGWLGWLVIANLWLVAVALVRDLDGSGSPGAAVGILQLIPTVVLVLYLALLLELAVADFGPSAADNAAGTAVALALVRALDAAPPRRLGVELVLQGAGDGAMIGLARHLRGRRHELGSHNAIVLGIGPCTRGRPCWWTGDGSLVPLRYHRGLREVAESLSIPPASVQAGPHRGRGISPALPARMAGIPAVNLGCLGDDGLAAGSHTTDDVAAALDAGALDALLEFGLTLVDAIDADLARRAAQAPAPALAPAQR